VTTSGRPGRLVYLKALDSNAERGLSARLSRYRPTCSVPYQSCTPPCVLVGMKVLVNR
jgi:hypothetical protein